MLVLFLGVPLGLAILGGPGVGKLDWDFSDSRNLGEWERAEGGAIERCCPDDLRVGKL